MDLSEYLSQSEVTQLNQAFERSLQDDRALVFWTGVSPNLAKDWACKNNLKTLSLAMGRLYSDNSHGSPRSQKSPRSWSKYMKGASWIFAQQACHDRFAIVLTNAPPNVYSTRERSNYRYIEEPILKGAETGRHAIRIEYVHPTVPSAARFRYQIWPDDRSSEWIGFLECIAIKDMFKRIVQNMHLQRSLRGPRYTEQNESENPIDSTASTPDGRDKNSETVQDTTLFGQRELDRAQQATRKKVAKRLEVEMEQQTAQKKKAAKRLKVERQEQAAQEKKVAKRLEVEMEQQTAQKKKAAKRLQVERQEQAAREKKAAKRLQVERQEQAAREKKAAKRLKVQLEQRAAWG